MASILAARSVEWPPAPVVGPDGPLGGYSATLLGCVWMEFILASIFLGLRIYTRYRVSKWAGWGLLWTVIAWTVGLIAQIILTVALARSLGGFGDHWPVSNGLMYLWVSIFLTFIAIGLSKFAIVAFVLAMQGMTHIRERYFLFFLAGSNMIVDLAFVFFMAFHCSPPYDMWVFGREASSCQGNFVSARGFGFFTGVWNAVTDLVLALYPLFLLRTVQIAPNVKRGLMAVMSLGVISFICAVVKTWDLRFVTSTAVFNVDIFCLTIWTYTEMWVVLITASIPPLWPLFKRARTTWRTSMANSRSWYASGHSRSTSGYTMTRSKDEKLLREKPSLPTSRSVAEGGLTITTVTASERESRAATPAWGHRINGMRSQSRAALHKDEAGVPEEGGDADFSPSSPGPAEANGIVVTTELSVQHEAISPHDDEMEDNDPDMRACWVRRVARDTESGRP